MAPGKAPSEGTKVNLGRNAPISTEGTGAVASDSLAAESQAFRNANDAQPHDYPHEQLRSSTNADAFNSESSHAAPGSRHTGRTAESGRSGAGEAPSYVTAQYQTGKGGPHGRNLTEDDSIGTEDRMKNASFASQIGAKDDPSLAAERKFGLMESTPVEPIGARQKKLDTKTPYEALNSSENA